MAEITNLRPQSHQELPGSIETFLEKAHYRILFALYNCALLRRV